MKVVLATHYGLKKCIPLRMRKYQHGACLPVLRVPDADTTILEFSDFYAITIVSASGALTPRRTNSFGKRGLRMATGITRQRLCFSSQHGNLAAAL